MHFILYRFKKINANFQCRIVIYAGSINVRYLLIEPALGRANILNTPDNLIKIINIRDSRDTSLNSML